MKLDLRMALNRTHDDAGDAFNLTIEDRDAGVQFVDIVLTPTEFAALVTGTSLRVTGEIRPRLLGMTAQACEVVVTVTDPAFVVYERKKGSASYAAAEAAVAATGAALDAETPCEGATPWHGDIEDVFNSHRRVAGGRIDSPHSARVIFRRHVPRPA